MLNPHEALKTTGQAHVYRTPLPVVQSLWPISTAALEQHQPALGLSRLQYYRGLVCLIGILVSNSVWLGQI